VNSHRSPEPQSLPLFAAHDEPNEAPRARPSRSVDPHLAAARRLSRAIRRTRDRSPEQLQTGRAICRHLVAMLKSETG
jgi:hypothetical protein